MEIPNMNKQMNMFSEIFSKKYLTMFVPKNINDTSVHKDMIGRKFIATFWPNSKLRQGVITDIVFVNGQDCIVVLWDTDHEGYNYPKEDDYTMTENLVCTVVEYSVDIYSLNLLTKAVGQWEIK